ncbi:hypothetical protein [Pseudoxanthomonas putridarboris]|uniref:Uncharacterized protein n=1 Tax=Pseudoxanthomonas putridarboris TaxID=752605 RepID=A0ABU9J616_9GAMM
MICLGGLVVTNANAISQGTNGDVIVEERDGNICFRIESYTEWKPSMFPRRLKRFDVDAGNVVIREIYVFQRSGSTRSWVAVAKQQGVAVKSRDALCYGATPTGFVDEMRPLPLQPTEYTVDLGGIDIETDIKISVMRNFCLVQDQEQLRLACVPQPDTPSPAMQWLRSKWKALFGD